MVYKEDEGRRTRDERRRCGGGCACANDDGGQTKDAAVNEAAARVLVDEDLVHELSHPVCALRRRDRVGRDHVGLCAVWAAQYGNRRWVVQAH